ncbi:MFS transporter [Sphingosinicella microcystinivorans]|uniref:MFS transporter n=1 Tax=Sphingosinicella microcystinivorans TaxID=335406 RepID=A0AAD1D452_SPHMI|nr:MFS transporter [Sphingosinicella microcystinivorans]RKS85411.1 MFS transporter [Sphingosinicella microcystinivorans]BBE33300.1 MFS transporter [Sphingosinicella microcystinivorans]
MSNDGESGVTASETRADWPKLTVIAFMYMAQTFPAGFAAGLMPTLYREQGLALEKFWLFSLAIIPYWVRWAIAPVVDSYWSPRIGPRRSWFIPCTFIAVLAYMSLALFEPTEAYLFIIVGILFVKSMFTATQEVAIDAYVVDNVTKSERPTAAAMNTVFEAAGQFAALAGLAIVYDRFGWQVAVCVSALLMLVFITPAFFRKERVDKAQLQRAQEAREGGAAALIQPLVRFFRRRDSYIIIPFVLAGGLYTGLMFPMVGPFLIDLGFGVGEIGAMVGTVLLAATVLGSLSSARLVGRLGERRLMFVLMVAIIPATLPVAYLAFTKAAISAPVAILVTFLPFFVLSMFYVTFVNLRLGYASALQAGTDYSIGSAISRIGQTIAAAIGGFIAAWSGWAGFFLVAALFGIGAMWLCWFTHARLQRLIEERNHSEQAGAAPAGIGEPALN